jgi:hypothetical protein
MNLVSRRVHWWMALAATLAPLVAQAQWRPELELGYLHDDNLSRAQMDADQVPDSALRGRVALGRGFELGAAGDARLAAAAGFTSYASSDGASFGWLGAEAGWRRKLGLGLTQPWLALDASLALENAREDVRDAWRGAVSASAGKRFSQALEASAGFAYDRREQLDDFAVVPDFGGKPFSIQGRSVFARVSYAAGERATLFGAAALRHGDVVSSTRRNFDIFVGSNAIALDPAFGPEFIAYRISGAATTTLSAGLAWELGPRSALEASVTKDDTHARGGLDYGALAFGVTFVYRQ